MSFLSGLMILIFILALILITIGLTQSHTVAVIKNDSEPPPPKIIYKYRSILDQQEDPTPLNISQYELFNGPNPWISNVDITRTRKDLITNINKYGISQF